MKWLPAALLLSALGFSAPPPATAGDREIEPGIHRLSGLDVDLPLDELAPLDRILRRAELVGLGEAIHTTRGFSLAKLRLFRYLVEEQGFRALGFESPWIDAEPVAEYVRTCAGDPETAMQGLFGVWRSESIRDFVRWMCQWNQDHPDDPVHFYGFDVQFQSVAEVARLRDLLLAMGIRSSDLRYRQLGDCTLPAAIAPPPEKHAGCLDVLDRLERHFDRRQRRILRRISPEDLEWARIHVVGLRAWVENVFYQDTDIWRSFAARDEGMAYVALAIRRIRFPGIKTAIWAHNGHIARARFVPGVAVMGVHLKRALRRRYKAVGLVAYDGEVDWPGIGCGLINTAADGSVEELLRRLGEPYLLVDLAFPGGSPPFLQRGRRYEINWGARLVPRRHFNGLVYMERAEKMRPLAWEPCDR